MRVLFTTRGNAGHLLPLVPFAKACAAAGHEVLVVAQRQHAAHVARTGLPHAPVDEPPDETWMPLMGEVAQLPIDAAHALMVGRYFGELDTRAALPGLREHVERFAPDVIVREVWEFASVIVAQERGIPLARVALGPAALEEETLALAAPALDALRPGALARAAATAPYLTMMPAALDDLAPPPWPVRRFATPVVDGDHPDPWTGGDDPLVYLSFGSVAAGRHLPYYPELYRRAITALAPLPIRLLVTTGDQADLAALDPLPPNVRVAHWVDQDTILHHAAAVVGHGGYGGVLGALRHGLAPVVVPLFSGDQWLNAATVAAAGAGIALDADRADRAVMGLPGREFEPALARAVAALLDPGAPEQRTARAIAEALRDADPPHAAVAVLEQLSAAGRAGDASRPSRTRARR